MTTPPEHTPATRDPDALTVAALHQQPTDGVQLDLLTPSLDTMEGASA